MADTEAVLLATGGYDHTIRLWQPHSGVCHRTLQHPESQVNALSLTPDKQLIAAAGFQCVRLYDVHGCNPNPVINCDGVQKNITAVGFHGDGRWMFTAGEDGKVRIWDLRSRNPQSQRTLSVSNLINCAVLHPNQVTIIAGDRSGTLHIWDLKLNQSERMVVSTDNAITCVDIDREASMLAVACSNGICHVYALRGSFDSEERLIINPKTQIHCHDTYVIKCRFSHDSTLLATTSSDGTIKVWRTCDFTLKSTLSNASQRWVWDCSFSTDPQYLISVSSDAVARLWNVENAKTIREYSGHQKAIVAMAFFDGNSTE
ncbi:Target of rapamycin complex subunit lst8 [Trichoplax sp. H2]|nr:Target of rapamycin complex subunit lst8 [Trichoplax sp. H2]|eukprot:RDD43873.1 Target of rapamycin complex subunit lst8 [Trichoplax sp. H2]